MDIVTCDLSRFYDEELSKAVALLQAFRKQRLPKGYSSKGLSLNINKKSGFVFLSNEDYQAFLLRNGKLVTWHNTPEEGHEGIYTELVKAADVYWCQDDIEYLINCPEYENLSADRKEKLKTLFDRMSNIS